MAAFGRGCGVALRRRVDPMDARLSMVVMAILSLSPPRPCGDKLDLGRAGCRRPNHFLSKFSLQFDLID